MALIYHIAQRDEWNEAKKLGRYWPSNPTNSPFIHFSFGHQVLEVAHFLFSGQRDMVLLGVEGAQVEKDLKLEAPPGSEEKYPHLYRALDPKDVIFEDALLPSADGRFDRLPLNNAAQQADRAENNSPE